MAKKKFRTHPFLHLFYNFVKGIVLFGFGIYYKKKTFINPEYLTDIDRPTIIISNHPSTMMDPLNVAKEVNGIVNFLANASMFSHWFTNWFFSTFYCIKVERPKDVDGRLIKNDKAFEFCDRFLMQQNGALYIAAEGTSKVERRLRPLKTGAARIAFSAASQADFELGLTIIPVGMTYEDPTRFRKEIIIHVGEPIKVAKYKEEWQGNQRAAVRCLTEDVQASLQALLVHTEPEDEAIAQLIEQLEIIEGNNTKKTFSELVQDSKNRLQQILTTRKSNPKAVDLLAQNTAAYFETLEQHKLTDEAVIKTNTIVDYLKLLIGFPFFLYGFFNNLLAFGIPEFINRKMGLYKGYDPAVKSMVSLITVPLFYWLQTKFLAPYIPFPYGKWIYVLTLIPMGLLAWEYMELGKRVGKRRRFEGKDSGVKEKLTQLREDIVLRVKEIQQVHSSA